MAFVYMVVLLLVVDAIQAAANEASIVRQAHLLRRRRRRRWLQAAPSKLLRLSLLIVRHPELASRLQAEMCEFEQRMYYISADCSPRGLAGLLMCC